PPFARLRGIGRETPFLAGGRLRAPARDHGGGLRDSDGRVRPSPLGALRAVSPGLGLVALGLDQERRRRPGDRDSTRVALLRHPAQEPAALVAVVLARASADPGVSLLCDAPRDSPR